MKRGEPKAVEAWAMIRKGRPVQSAKMYPSASKWALMELDRLRQHDPTWELINVTIAPKRKRSEQPKRRKAGRSVFVIEQGSYSDYRVVGVYDSREAADLACDWLNAGDDHYDKATVAEWPLNPCSAEINAGFGQWNIHMAYDGTTLKCERDDGTYRSLGNGLSIWERTKAPAYKHDPSIRDILVGTVWAKDDKHAIKIANERRVQLIASGEFRP